MITPGKLLRVWRERWDKVRPESQEYPYLRGKIHDSLLKIPRARFWQSFTSRVLACLGILLITLLALATEYKRNGEISFSAALVIPAFFLQAYAGPLFTLILLFLSAIAAGRYFIWRFTETLIDLPSWVQPIGYLIIMTELLVYIYFVFSWWVRLNPVIQKPFPLPSVRDNWPKVELLIRADRMSTAQIRQRLGEIKSLDWPAARLAVTMVERELRPSVELLIKESPIDYRVIEASDDFESIALAQVMEDSSAEFVVNVHPELAIEKDALTSQIGWFTENEELECIYGHALFPPGLDLTTPKSIDIEFAEAASTTIIPLKNWKKVLDDHPSASQASLRTLFFNFAADSHAIAFRNTQTNGTDWFRVDLPARRRRLLFRQEIAKLHDVLAFYAPLVWLLLLSMPAISILSGIPMMVASTDSILIMLLPHLVIAIWIQGRLFKARRTSFATQCTDVIKATSISFQTAYCFAKTWLTNPILSFRRSFFDAFDGYATLKAMVAIGLTLLNFVGLTFGFLENFFLGLCCLFNLVVLIATQAVLHEKRHLGMIISQRRQLAVFAKLPSGKIIPAVIRNFPEQPIVLEGISELETDGIINLSCPLIDPWGKAVMIQAIAEHRSKGSASIHQKGQGFAVSKESVDLWKNWEASYFVRDQDWPGWLPGETADRLAPLWLSQKLEPIYQRVIAVYIGLMQSFSWKVIKELWTR